MLLGVVGGDDGGDQVAGVFIFLLFLSFDNFGHLQVRVLEIDGIPLGLEDFEECDIDGEIGHVIVLEVDHGAIFGTDQLITTFLLSDNLLDTGLAESMATGDEQPGWISITVLIFA